MTELAAAAGSAIWLGVLTSISPCPLATNIAAMSFISRNVQRTSSAVLSGVAYTVGRTLTYLVLGILLVSASHAAPAVSMFLQQKIKLFTGPLLIVVGVVLLDVVRLALPVPSLPPRLQERLARSGPLGALALGGVFALSFCPASAALFFGSTFGLAVAHNSRLLIPSLYGIGTAAPVVVFGLVVALSTHAVGVIFHRVTIFEKWARRVSGLVFVVAGLYLVLTVNLHVFG
jgi:cytochrome c biogenesis protein CcdA